MSENRFKPGERGFLRERDIINLQIESNQYLQLQQIMNNEYITHLTLANIESKAMVQKFIEYFKAQKFDYENDVNNVNVDCDINMWPHFLRYKKCIASINENCLTIEHMQSAYRNQKVDYTEILKYANINLNKVNEKITKCRGINYKCKYNTTI